MIESLRQTKTHTCSHTHVFTLQLPFLHLTFSHKGTHIFSHMDSISSVSASDLFVSSIMQVVARQSKKIDDKDRGREKDFSLSTYIYAPAHEKRGSLLPTV